MTTQVDSIKFNQFQNVKIVTNPNDLKNVDFNIKQENIGDTFISTTTQNETVTTEHTEEAEKKAKRKKLLIAGGIALGLTAIGIATYCLTKKAPTKIVNKTSTTIAGDFPETLAKMDDFNVFKDLKMCRNMSLEEKHLAHKIITNYGNKEMFLATLNDDKPMSILNSCLRADDLSPNPMEVLKKLDLGDNFEFYNKPSWSTDYMNVYNTYFVNKQQLKNTIENNKEIYTSRLNLKKDSKISEIYNKLFEDLNTPDDLLGISLGFPRYDSMIFHLEHVGNLSYKNRSLPDFSEKILEVLKSDKSPYKNLSTDKLKILEHNIKNISQKNLQDIASKGSYNDIVYQFVNYCDDPEELGRLAASTNHYIQVFGL